MLYTEKYGSLDFIVKRPNGRWFRRLIEISSTKRSCNVSVHISCRHFESCFRDAYIMADEQYSNYKNDVYIISFNCYFFASTLLWNQLSSSRVVQQADGIRVISIVVLCLHRDVSFSKKIAEMRIMIQSDEFGYFYVIASYNNRWGRREKRKRVKNVKSFNLIRATFEGIVGA